MTPELPNYSPDPALTADQHHVLAILVEGHSLSAAAETVGIHRNTIRNWRRAAPAFAREVEFAVREQAPSGMSGLSTSPPKPPPSSKKS
jgi:hypothetical protein